MPGQHTTPKRNLNRSPIDKAKAYEVVWPQVAPLFEVARRYANASFVYLIGEPDEGMLKIGFSKDPIGRLRGMQTGNPRRLRMEYVLVGAMATEKLIHQFWEPYAVLSAANKGTRGSVPGTEWFRPEARAKLLPIFKEAVRSQLDLLDRPREDPSPSFGDLEYAVRLAHAASDYVPHVVAPTVQLAAGAGYNFSRRTRI